MLIANFDKSMFNISGMMILASEKSQMIKIIPYESPTPSKKYPSKISSPSPEGDISLKS